MHISTPTPDIQFKADNLMLGFCRDTALSLVSIAGYDGAEWLVGPITGEGVWRLAFRGPDGTSPVIRHGDAEFVGADAAGGKVLLRWRIYLNENLPTEVVVTIRPDSAQRFSLWAIEAGVPDGWQVTRCDFPVLPNLSMEPDSAAVVPAGWGVQYALQPGFDYAASYPSCLAAMQCVFITQSHSVLYLAAHDARANLKSFSLRGGIRGAKFECSVPASPDWQCTGVFRLPYEFAVGIVHGGLFEAAAIYREFSLSTPWGCAGSVADRGIPKWLLETDLWLRPDGSPEANIAVTGEALDYFGAGTALHWYRWHKVRYDTHYPEYFPPLPGFAEAVAAMQERGAPVMPYINGRLWDPASESWSADGAAAAAARREDGSCYSEVYGSRIPNNVMCPTTPLWRRKVTELVGRMTGELGVKGVYIDQIGAAAGVPCHAQKHSHAPGGGAFWHEGYRELLREVRRVLPEGAIITTEENAECWLDQFDAMLVVNTPTDGGIPVPLFPAVYSDRALLFGFQYFPAPEPVAAAGFRAKMARCFIWGSQVGWIQPSRIMATGVGAEAEFLRALARARRHARRYITGGRLVATVDLDAQNEPIFAEAHGSFGGTYMLAIDAVVGALWQAPDGSRAVLAANQSDQDRRVGLATDRLSGTRLTGDTLRVLGPDGELSAADVSHGYLDFVVPARSACVVQLADGA